MKFVECIGYEESFWDCCYFWVYYYFCGELFFVYVILYSLKGWKYVIYGLG